MIRKPIVAGQFYSSDSKKLKNDIETLKPKDTSKISAKGIILPHAGYIYSGKVAVATVNKAIPKKRIIILGPNHTGLGKDFSIFSQGKWETPLGDIEIDSILAKLIVEAGGIIKEDYTAHAREHSIEVELPILQHFFNEFKFVPIVCAVSTFTIYQQAARQIFNAIENIKDEILLVASTDMTHYEPDSAARRKDSLAIESIVNLDAKQLLKRIDTENISMCGAGSVAILLECCKLMQAKKAEIVLYQTSGEASGDYSSVVGYLGAIIN